MGGKRSEEDIGTFWPWRIRFENNRGVHIAAWKEVARYKEPLRFEQIFERGKKVVGNGFMKGTDHPECIKI